MIVSGIGRRSVYSVKVAASKGMTSIFYVENPRIFIPLEAEKSNLYSFVLHLSADG